MAREVASKQVTGAAHGNACCEDGDTPEVHQAPGGEDLAATIALAIPPWVGIVQVIVQLGSVYQVQPAQSIGIQWEDILRDDELADERRERGPQVKAGLGSSNGPWGASKEVLEGEVF
ncbi:hypothetical protein TRAPUB_13966 [Trametes pubescens]|uniref:Uncharacterized protein n=1 Tax=Trametes pubescens TaxID=154538 RepID=A0A1M2VPR0_TRAPU|nr:hypothetical protein TRAPUB_13966 [Trametes pubescens]